MDRVIKQKDAPNLIESAYTAIIKDNRIVSDRTFAIRLINFLRDIKVNDPASEEELSYLKHVADRLLVHQRNTAVHEGEKLYLESCWPFEKYEKHRH